MTIKWTITRYWWIWGQCPQYESCYGQWLKVCTQYNFTSLITVLRLQVKVQKYCFCSKIWSNAKWPLSNRKSSNAFEIWYLSENELIWDFWGHIGLKQPRNHKFKFGWARAKSTRPHINQPVDFFRNHSFKKRTNY